MRHFTKLYDGVDVQPLLSQLESHPELWDQHTMRKLTEGSPHSRMSDIWVRYNSYDRYDPNNRAKFNEEHVSVWYPAWKKLPALRPIIFDLMAFVQGEWLGAVLITKIAPGEGIDLHKDAGWHVAQTEKFYLSLKSSPDSEFICHEGEREILSPKPGEMWLFDNRKLHSVENNSTEDRITLIVCIRTELFGRA